MTHNEFKRWLAKQGCTFEEAKKHSMVVFKGKRATLPRHGTQEIGEGLRKAILKQLGMK